MGALISLFLICCLIKANGQQSYNQLVYEVTPSGKILAGKKIFDGKGKLLNTIEYTNNKISSQTRNVYKGDLLIQESVITGTEIYKTRWTYDSKGREISRKESLDGLLLLYNKSYYPNLLLKITYQIEPKKGKRVLGIDSIFYDQQGRIISEKVARNREITGHIKYLYDDSSSVLRYDLINNDTLQTITKYDKGGRKSEILMSLSDGFTERTNYEYDFLSRIIKEVTTMNDSVQNVISYSYNSSGFLESKIVSDKEKGMDSTINFEMNTGRMKRLLLSRFDGKKWEYEFEYLDTIRPYADKRKHVILRKE